MLRILIYYVIYCAITGKRVNIHYVIMASILFRVTLRKKISRLCTNLLHVESPTFASVPYRDN